MAFVPYPDAKSLNYGGGLPKSLSAQSAEHAAATAAALAAGRPATAANSLFDGPIPTSRPNLLRQLTGGLQSLFQRIHHKTGDRFRRSPLHPPNSVYHRNGADQQSHHHVASPMPLTQYDFTRSDGFLRISSSLPLLNYRYRVLRLVGEGTFSQLIVAEDTFAPSPPSQHHLGGMYGSATINVQTTHGGGTHANTNGGNATIPKHRLVALKVMNSKYAFIGIQELDKLFLLNQKDQRSWCPIVRVQGPGAFYFQTHLVIVLELLGPALLAYMKTLPRGRVPVEQLRKIALQLVLALGYVSAAGMIHGDIKPENVLLEPRGRAVKVKLIDFGNAMTLHEAQAYYEDFEVQTLYYRAPEVVLGVKFNQQIDMWSLGCLLVELATGKPMFNCSGNSQLFQYMQAVLGPCPSGPFQSGRFFKQYFGGDATSSQHTPPEDLGNENQLVRITNIAKLLHSKDPDFVSFIHGLLEYDPNRRLSSHKALLHPFLSQLFPLTVILGEHRPPLLTSLPLSLPTPGRGITMHSLRKAQEKKKAAALAEQMKVQRELYIVQQQQQQMMQHKAHHAAAASNKIGPVHTSIGHHTVHPREQQQQQQQQAAVYGTSTASIPNSSLGLLPSSASTSQSTGYFGYAPTGQISNAKTMHNQPQTQHIAYSHTHQPAQHQSHPHQPPSRYSHPSLHQSSSGLPPSSLSSLSSTGLMQSAATFATTWPNTAANSATTGHAMSQIAGTHSYMPSTTQQTILTHTAIQQMPPTHSHHVQQPHQHQPHQQHHQQQSYQYPPSSSSYNFPSSTTALDGPYQLDAAIDSHTPPATVTTAATVTATGSKRKKSDAGLPVASSKSKRSKQSASPVRSSPPGFGSPPPTSSLSSLGKRGDEAKSSYRRRGSVDDDEEYLPSRRRSSVDESVPTGVRRSRRGSVQEEPQQTNNNRNTQHAYAEATNTHEGEEDEPQQVVKLENKTSASSKRSGLARSPEVDSTVSPSSSPTDDSTPFAAARRAFLRDPAPPSSLSALGPSSSVNSPSTSTTPLRMGHSPVPAPALPTRVQPGASSRAAGGVKRENMVEDDSVANGGVGVADDSFSGVDHHLAPGLGASAGPTSPPLTPSSSLGLLGSNRKLGLKGVLVPSSVRGSGPNSPLSPLARLGFGSSATGHTGGPGPSRRVPGAAALLERHLHTESPTPSPIDFLARARLQAQAQTHTQPEHDQTEVASHEHMIYPPPSAYDHSGLSDGAASVPSSAPFSSPSSRSPFPSSLSRSGSPSPGRKASSQLPMSSLAALGPKSPQPAKNTAGLSSRAKVSSLATLPFNKQ